MTEDTAENRAAAIAWSEWNAGLPPDESAPRRPRTIVVPLPIPAAPPSSPRVALAGDIGVLLRLDGIRHAGDVVDIARASKVSQLWVPRSVADEFDETFVADALETHDIRPEVLAPWLYGWHREHRRDAVHVVLAALDESPFAALDADALVRALVAFRDAVGVAFRRSPGATGTDLLRAVRRDPGPASATPEPAASGQQEQDFAWCRDLTEEERALPFVHVYDANAQYLAACSSALCGLGEPEHVTRPKFDAKRAGYWRCTIEGERDELLPDPFNVGPAVGYKLRRRERGQIVARWHSTATVQLAEQLGRRVVIGDAWLYPRSQRFLRPWYEKLRAARGQLLELQDVAPLDALKATYRITLGWLAGSFHDATDPLYRPQWRHAVIATARANLYRRLLKLDARPFAIETDALYFASAQHAPLSGAPKGLPITEQLGHFKPHGNARMEDALAAMHERSDYKKLSALRSLTEGGGR